MIRVLRRATIPDLTDRGLPRPSEPFSQFRRTATVHIIDVGFVDAVRKGVIEVVPAVTALDGRAVVLTDGSQVFPDAIVAATGYHPGLEPLVGDVTQIGEHGVPRPQSSFPRHRYPALGTATRLARTAASVARELSVGAGR